MSVSSESLLSSSVSPSSVSSSSVSSIEILTLDDSNHVENVSQSVPEVSCLKIFGCTCVFIILLVSWFILCGANLQSIDHENVGLVIIHLIYILLLVVDMSIIVRMIRFMHLINLQSCYKIPQTAFSRIERGLIGLVSVMAMLAVAFNNVRFDTIISLITSIIITIQFVVIQIYLFSLHIIPSQ